MTPLGYATSSKKPYWVKLLLKYGASANADTRTGNILKIAIKSKNTEIINLILERVDNFRQLLKVIDDSDISAGIKSAVQARIDQLLNQESPSKTTKFDQDNSSVADSFSVVAEGASSERHLFTPISSFKRSKLSNDALAKHIKAEDRLDHMLHERALFSAIRLKNTSLDRLELHRFELSAKLLAENPFIAASHYVTSDELTILTESLIKDSGIIFAILDGNDESSITTFIKTHINTVLEIPFKVAAINISANGQPSGLRQGNHWVMYVEYYDADDGVVKACLINSHNANYSQGISKVSTLIKQQYADAGLEFVFLSPQVLKSKNINLAALDLQIDGNPSCGIWLLEFLKYICDQIRENSIENQNYHKVLLQFYNFILQKCDGDEAKKLACAEIQMQREYYGQELESAGYSVSEIQAQVIENIHDKETVKSVVSSETLKTDQRLVSIAYYAICSNCNATSKDYEVKELKNVFMLIEYKDIKGHWICNKISSDNNVERFERHPRDVDSAVRKKIFGPMEYETGKVPIYYSTSCVASLGGKEMTGFLSDVNGNSLPKQLVEEADICLSEIQNIKKLIQIYNLQNVNSEIEDWLNKAWYEIVQYKFTRAQILALIGDDKVEDMKEYQRNIGDVLREQHTETLKNVQERVATLEETIHNLNGLKSTIEDGEKNASAQNASEMKSMIDDLIAKTRLVALLA